MEGQSPTRPESHLKCKPIPLRFATQKPGQCADPKFFAQQFCALLALVLVSRTHRSCGRRKQVNHGSGTTMRQLILAILLIGRSGVWR